ncbi:segregation/condensation protein A [Streptococcus macacae]|uniref:Segregation and condensation protein A n=1 Tax=Streptococcus macacae NCTC 11558 TaxID=764298 RepID=G5JY77_9STRE|nr:segregation/condensation protein A [Streptococcus macacae]EHJ52299.1 ScpA/B protein [Streptococcus macacae NCTC 11558]SUN77992.1 segregation and condensation protein A [Streptococcus macacae NCTC 11558]
MDIKLKDFEGPLDLLLHLVSKYEVDIYDVPIVEVIEQYLSYLATLQAMKLEIAGEYMLMASQLMLIKSRKLLPKLVETLEEEDPELELLQQIEDYRTYKLLGEQLNLRHEERALYFSKPKMDLVYENTALKHDKSVLDIFLAFSKVMSEKQEEIKNNHTTIESDDFRIEDKMMIIEEELLHQSKMNLSDIFQKAHSPNEIVTIFLAVLELIKVHRVFVKQAHNFSDIILTREKV